MIPVLGNAARKSISLGSWVILTRGGQKVGFKLDANLQGYTGVFCLAGITPVLVLRRCEVPGAT